MAWYLVFLCVAATIVLIDRPTLTPVLFCLAIVTAVIGSFSSLQGLLIWQLVSFSCGCDAEAGGASEVGFSRQQ